MTEVLSSENLRGWMITLDDPDGDCETIRSNLLECWIDKGETKNITVTVKSPYNAELEDTFDFTVSAQPECEKDFCIGRVNQQFDVTGDVESSLFAFAEDTTVVAVGGGFVFLVLLGFLISRRT